MKEVFFIAVFNENGKFLHLLERSYRRYEEAQQSLLTMAGDINTEIYETYLYQIQKYYTRL